MRPALSACPQARPLLSFVFTSPEPVMNHDDPTHRSPPRAEPIQPDRPGRGADKQTDRKPAENDGRSHAEKLKEQSENALENTREGYGGG
jgi:hypothetical protein